MANEQTKVEIYNPVRTQGFLESLALRCTVTPKFEGNAIRGYRLVNDRTFTSFPEPKFVQEDENSRYFE
ncbi:MAG: hypothetical protein WCK29_01495 [archaeon]